MVRKLRMFVIAGLVVGALVAASLAIAGVLDKPLKSPKVPPSKHFTAVMNSYQEAPLTNSTAGFGDFTADLVSDTQLHYTLRYSGLEGGNTLFAHVHIGQRGTAGGVMFFLCGGGGKPACPNVSGEISGDVTASEVIGPSGQGVSPGEFDEAVKAMRAGYAYANVHTVTYVTGEIRGQINSDTGEKIDK